MRGKALTGLVALAMVDLLVVGLGYRAHTGSLPALQRSAPSFEVSLSPNASPTREESGDEVVGPVLLGVNSAGDILRATRGACEERFDNPARIWAGNVDDGVAPSAVEPPLREVLGLIVYDNGRLRVSGLDLDDQNACVPVTYDSTDGGQTWQTTDDVATVWRMSGDVTASAVTSPRGVSVEVPCLVAQIVNLPARRAVASCGQVNYFELVPGGDVILLTAEAYDELSVTAGPGDQSYLLLGSTDGCTASLAVARPQDPDVDELQCFDEEKAPLAIAAAEGFIVVQLGDDLRVSSDDGQTFETLAVSSIGESPAADS
jgi:hypothetical protein